MTDKQVIKDFVEMMERNACNKWGALSSDIAKGEWHNTLMESREYQALKASIAPVIGVMASEGEDVFAKEGNTIFVVKKDAASGSCAVTDVISPVSEDKVHTISVKDMPPQSHWEPTDTQSNHVCNCPPEKSFIQSGGIQTPFPPQPTFAPPAIEKVLDMLDKATKKKEPKKQTLLEFIKNHPARNNTMLVMTNMDYISEYFTYLEEQNKCK